jgi:ribosomal protein S18 acetylase RimI-like enzyme
MLAPVSVRIREARAGDARALVEHLRRLAAEPGINIPLSPDEVTPTVEQQRELIEEISASPRRLLLVAEEGEARAGEHSLAPMSLRRAIAHVAVLGMSVHAGWRGRGVGTALMTEALAWAPGAGFSRIELNVYARNAAAIGLYEKFGFEREGRRRRFIREGDVYLDDLVMAKLL